MTESAHPLERNARRIVDAIRAIDRLHPLGDAIYHVRERAAGDASYSGNTWEHPDVKAYSDAVRVLYDTGVLQR